PGASRISGAWRRSLVSGGRLFQRRLNRGFFRSADVEAERALLALDAVDRRTSDQVAVKLDGARGVIISRDRVVDDVRIAVRIDDRHDRDAKATSRLYRNYCHVCVAVEHLRPR